MNMSARMFSVIFDPLVGLEDKLECSELSWTPSQAWKMSRVTLIPEAGLAQVQLFFPDRC